MMFDKPIQTCRSRKDPAKGGKAVVLFPNGIAVFTPEDRARWEALVRCPSFDVTRHVAEISLPDEPAPQSDKE